ncbi:MAG: 2-hydroxychromene-2-carboxylate isomerase [Methyloligellaceae bacterium]
MSAKQIEVWIEFGSPYTHIAVQTIEDKARNAGLSIVWRPFLIGAIFQLQGYTDTPVNLFKPKGNYMWRDMVRQCEALNVPYKKPDIFPINGITAARIATAADGQPWQGDFIRETFMSYFYQGQDITSPAILSEALNKGGCSDIEAALNTATLPEIKDKLKARTQEAINRGIFGSPSFFVGDELFWGSDRIEQAVAFASSR